MDYPQTIAVLLNSAIFLAVIELVRRNLLKIRYSLIWIAASLTMVALSWRPVLHLMARITGIEYPPSFLFMFAIVFLIILLLDFSTAISSLSEKNTRLAQEIGVLKNRLEKIEHKIPL